MSYQQKMIDVAKKELGTKESDGGDDKYIKWYGGFALNVSWCAIFISWCAYALGLLGKVIPKFASCDAGMEWFKTKDLFKATPEYGGKKYTPEPGDIMFLSGTCNPKDSTHVAIVVDADTNYVYTVEGNAGDAVRERTYKITDKKILGYAVPEYPKDASEVKKPAIKKPETKKPAVKEDSFTLWVKKLQKELGLVVTGIPGVTTLSKTPTLKKGSKGEIVGLVQQRLLDMGFDIGTHGIDKSYGPSTETAVKNYQRTIVKLGTPDGIIDGGKNTWKALLQLK